jgi:acyl-coenzyme A synthetase/AMP-(fatty) acid ligase
VYCSEVEAVLAAHPAVAEVAVFGLPSTLMGEMVAAAVVTKQTWHTQQATATAGLVTELVAWCGTRLAHYKVPSQVRLGDAASCGSCMCAN